MTCSHLLAQHDFNGSVVVQARQTTEETEWLLQSGRTGMTL